MQGFNLIREKWIPVRHASGRLSWRAPCEVFGEPDDPAVALASPRADFDGGLVQLLIGLLQVALAPERDRDWERRARSGPPDAAELRDLLEPFAGAFELLGPGPRFYQDPSVAAYGGEAWSVEKLLIDLSVGEGGGDLFARNGSVRALCPACAAAALATLQASAPAGGRGNMTSLRGGGPLTTLVLPDPARATLWTALWLNVVPLARLRPNAEADVPPADEIFPWLRTPRIEPKQAPKITPEDAPELQVYFGMPRRLWLAAPGEGECGLCGRSGEVIAEYQSRPNGNSYAGAWQHPLSPYRRFKDEQWLAVKGDERGIGYRYWLGLAIAGKAGDIQPALPVRLLQTQSARAAAAGRDQRLWAFGYAMDNMKAVAWSEGRMPIFEISEELVEAFAAEIRSLVEAAQQAELAVRRAFKSLVARRAQDVKRDPEQIVARFWQDTESAFYQHAHALLRALQAAPAAAEATLEQRLGWHRVLSRSAKTIFDAEVGEADFRALNPVQVATAWKELQQTLNSKKFKDLLRLPAAEEKKKKGGRQ